MTSPIVICTQTFPPKMGGMEAVMASLAEHFTHAGYSVSVFADAPFKDLKNYDFYAAQVPKFIRPYVKSSQISRNATPDAWVICDSWKSVGAVPKNFKKIVVLAHGQEYLNKEKKRRRIKQALGRASMVVSSSNATAAMVRDYAPDSLPVHTIYPTYMLQNPALGKVAKRSSFRIFSISRIERRKGLFQSAEALTMLLSDSNQRVEWRIAGSGPDLEALQSHTRSLGLTVKFLGRISESEKQTEFNQADLFLMPSYQEGNSLEGFGITYIEAAAFGVPSIGGLAGGAAEAVLDQKTGWSVDGSDPKAIQAALAEAISDTDKRLSYGQAAKERFTRNLVGYQAFDRLVSLIEAG